MSPFTFSILRLWIMAVILLLLGIVFVVAKTEAFIGGFSLKFSLISAYLPHPVQAAMARPDIRGPRRDEIDEDVATRPRLRGGEGVVEERQQMWRLVPGWNENFRNAQIIVRLAEEGISLRSIRSRERSLFGGLIAMHSSSFAELAQNWLLSEPTISPNS